MGYSFITRRFIRIKALQHFYAYTIAQQAYKKQAIEQIEKEFLFDSFKPISRAQLAEDQAAAVALFYQNLAEEKPSDAFSESSKDEQVVRKHLVRYREGCLQNQSLLQDGLGQSKTYLYIDYCYIMLLLVEWHKIAKAELSTCNQQKALLQYSLALNPILIELTNNSNWMDVIKMVIPTEELRWLNADDRVHDWYMQLIRSVKLPEKLPDAVSTSGVKFLEYIIQTIIFSCAQIEDFFVMRDIYWDLHKPMLARLLSDTLGFFETKSLDLFVSFWKKLETQWREGAKFYSQLVQVTMEHSVVYERVIGEKAEKWASERMLLIDKLILKLALTEVRSFEEIPIKVSLNEYIDLAKLYGTAKSSSFVNGILEGIFTKTLKT